MQSAEPQRAFNIRCLVKTGWNSRTRLVVPQAAMHFDWSLSASLQGPYSKWFLDNTKPEWRGVSINSKALFYTSGLSKTARTFAKKDGNDLVTIWEGTPFVLNVKTIANRRCRKSGRAPITGFTKLTSIL